MSVTIWWSTRFLSHTDPTQLNQSALKEGLENNDWARDGRNVLFQYPLSTIDEYGKNRVGSVRA